MRAFIVRTCYALTAALISAILLAGCASSKSPQPSGSHPSTASPSPHTLVGYWFNPKPSADWQADWAGPMIFRIQRRGGAWFFQEQYMPSAAHVNVKANRFAFNSSPERWVISLAKGGDEVDWATYRVGPDHKPKLEFIEMFQRARGSEAALVAELRGRGAFPTISMDIEELAAAIDLWDRHFGSCPPRSALLPGGVFWKWPHAPHLKNAATGRPMVLGPGVGNFDYKTDSSRQRYGIFGHLWDGSVTGRSSL